MTQRFSNVQDVPLALAVFLASDDYDYSGEAKTISTTTLLKPLRQIILPTRLPAEMAMLPLGEMMTLRLGNAIHSGIENAWLKNYKSAMDAMGMPQRVIDKISINPSAKELEADPDCIPVYLEQRTDKKIGNWTVTGKFDFVAEGRLEDFKTASVWSYMNQTNYDKQSQQGSIYRWLNPDKVTKDVMAIHHIFMDWKAGMVKTNPKYPTKRFVSQNIPLMSVAETENFIHRKLSLIDQYWDAPEEQIPYCTDEELWRNEPVFKYYKNGDTSAARSTKNFADKQEAYVHLSTMGVGAIKEVPGEVTACKYCPAYAICTQKDVLIAAGELLLNQ